MISCLQSRPQALFPEAFGIAKHCDFTRNVFKHDSARSFFMFTVICPYDQHVMRSPHTTNNSIVISPEMHSNICFCLFVCFPWSGFRLICFSLFLYHFNEREICLSVCLDERRISFVYVCVYIYIYMYLSLSLYTYIYIYI